MIYPRSFPTTGASYAEEKLYGLLAELPSDRYRVFYKSYNVPVHTENGHSSLIDFIVIDKKIGLFLIKVSSENRIEFSDNLQIYSAYYNAIATGLSDIGIPLPLSMKHLSWPEKDLQYSSIQDWLRKRVLYQNHTPLSEESFHKIYQFFKAHSLYYTPRTALKSFYLQHFKGIEQVNIKGLNPKANWIFLAGENGYGKTCLLQAIALGLYGSDAHLPTYEENSSTGSAEIQHNSIFLSILLESFDNRKDREYFFPKKSDSINFRNICAYGASRLSVFTERQSKQDNNPIASLFDNTTVLQNIEHHLYDWFLNKGDQVAQDRYHYIKQLLEELLEGIQIEVSTTSKRIWYKETREGQSYPPVTLNNLAAGYKSLLAMIGDLIIRLFESQPDAINPAELTGIVIIDELDVHWHPKWQMKLPKLFSKLLPEVQFIVSTHSPIPLLGAPKDSIFLKVDRTEEKGITVERFEKLEKEIDKLTPNLLLSSDIFDFDFLENLSDTQVGNLYVEDNYEDIEKNKEIEKRLKEIDEDILPDDLFSQSNS